MTGSPLSFLATQTGKSIWRGAFIGDTFPHLVFHGLEAICSRRQSGQIRVLDIGLSFSNIIRSNAVSHHSKEGTEMADQNDPSREQQNELLFMQLVMMFQGMALQNLGKVMNPVTNQIERDLDQAKNMIDILGMLDAKTKGNLNDNEQRLLEHALFELRMNYVDEIKKGDAENSDERASDEGVESTSTDSEETS